MAESTLGWGGLTTSTSSRDISLGTLNLFCDVDKTFCNHVLSPAMLILKGSHYCINSTGKTLNTPHKCPTTISVLQILSQEGFQKCSYLLGSVGAEGERVIQDDSRAPWCQQVAGPGSLQLKDICTVV